MCSWPSSQDGHRYKAGRSGVLAWLLGIARNQARRRLWRGSSPRSAARSRGRDRKPLAVETDPIAGLARDRQVDTVRRALRHLPVSYREVVVLCDLQELTYVEAADVVGCAIGTVRSRLHRGRALLGAQLRREQRGLTRQVIGTRLGDMNGRTKEGDARRRATGAGGASSPRSSHDGAGDRSRARSAAACSLRRRSAAAAIAGLVVVDGGACERHDGADRDERDCRSAATVPIVVRQASDRPGCRRDRPTRSRRTRPASSSRGRERSGCRRSRAVSWFAWSCRSRCCRRLASGRRRRAGPRSERTSWSDRTA